MTLWLRQLGQIIGRSVDWRDVGESRSHRRVVRGQQRHRWLNFQFKRSHKADHPQALLLSQPVVVREIRERLACFREIMNLIAYGHGFHGADALIRKMSQGLANPLADDFSGDIPVSHTAAKG